MYMQKHRFTQSVDFTATNIKLSSSLSYTGNGLSGLSVDVHVEPPADPISFY